MNSISSINSNPSYQGIPRTSETKVRTHLHAEFMREVTDGVKFSITSLNAGKGDESVDSVSDASAEITAYEEKMKEETAKVDFTMNLTINETFLRTHERAYKNAQPGGR